jgi:hypothetical protein
MVLLDSSPVLLLGWYPDSFPSQAVSALMVTALLLAALGTTSFPFSSQKRKQIYFSESKNKSPRIEAC